MASGAVWGAAFDRLKGLHRATRPSSSGKVD